MKQLTCMAKCQIFPFILVPWRYRQLDRTAEPEPKDTYTSNKRLYKSLETKIKKSHFGTPFKVAARLGEVPSTKKIQKTTLKSMEIIYVTYCKCNIKMSNICY